MCSVQKKYFAGNDVLIQKAIDLSKDGVLSKEDKTRIIDIAAADDFIDEEEKEIIRGLDFKDNLDSIQSANFDPHCFAFNVRSGEEYTSTNLNLATPIQGTKVMDTGLKFEKEFLNTGNTVASMSKDIISSPRVSANPELKQSVLDFLNTLEPTDREALVYLKELVLNRKPPMTDADLKKSIDKLTAMMKTDNYDPRVGDKKTLVLSGLHDIAAPSDISQMHIGSCTATSLQIQFSIRNPVGYLDMLDTLAKNQPYKIGTYVTSGEIKPNWTFAQEGNGNYSTGRSISSKIMQNSIMDYASESGIPYNSTDKNAFGLDNDAQIKAIRNLLGQDATVYANENFTPAELIKIVKEAKPSDTNPIEISICYDEDGRDAFHAVSVTAIDDKNVTIINPWGREETWSIDKLNSRIYDVFAPQGNDKGITRLSAEQVIEEGAKSDTRYNYYIGWEDPVTMLLNDPVKSTVALSSMPLEEKVKLIKEIKTHDSTLSDKDKLAILTVLQSIYRGSQGQDLQVLDEFNTSIYNNFSTKNHEYNLINLMTEIKIDNPLFYSVGADAVRGAGDIAQNPFKLKLAMAIFLPEKQLEYGKILVE